MQGEDLGDHQPEDRAESDREAGDADDQCDQCQVRNGVTQARRGEEHPEHHQGDDQPDRADDQEDPSSEAVKQEYRDDGEDNVGQADEDGLGDRARDAAAGEAQDRRRVIDNRVDADDLLEDRERKSRRSASAEPWRR
jgi:hypothetical protein